MTASYFVYIPSKCRAPLKEDKIAAALLERHPELLAIGEAIEQNRRGGAIVAVCKKCEKALEVTEVAATGALIVTCPGGHISFRATRDKAAVPPSRTRIDD